MDSAVYILTRIDRVVYRYEFTACNCKSSIVDKAFIDHVDVIIIRPLDRCNRIDRSVFIYDNDLLLFARRRARD